MQSPSSLGRSTPGFVRSTSSSARSTPGFKDLVYVQPVSERIESLLSVPSLVALNQMTERDWLRWCPFYVIRQLKDPEGARARYCIDRKKWDCDPNDPSVGDPTYVGRRYRSVMAGDAQLPDVIDENMVWPLLVQLTPETVCLLAMALREANQGLTAAWEPEDQTAFWKWLERILMGQNANDTLFIERAAKAYRMAKEYCEYKGGDRVFLDLVKALEPFTLVQGRSNYERLKQIRDSIRFGVRGTYKDGNAVKRAPH